MTAPATETGEFSVDPKYGYFKYECAENQHELWFDYAADVGDGFNSTYYVASPLAREHSVFNPEPKRSRRPGDIGIPVPRTQTRHRCHGAVS